jgi:Tfp pilus assembly protein FimT
VVVAAVLVVVTVSAVPHLQRGWVSALTERTAFQIAQSLRSARTLAITGTRMVDWMWDDEEQRICMGSADAADCAATDLPDRLARPRRVPSPLRLAVTRDGQTVSRVRFFPDGTSQSATVVVNDATAPRYTIVIDGPTSQVAVHAATLASPR